jgi:hypothetical protein
MTAVVNLVGKFQCVSPLQPYAKSDIERLRELAPQFLHQLDNSDEIVLDSVYESIDREVTTGKWHVKKKKHGNQELSEEDKQRNREIEEIRRVIETAFGHLKGKFRILSDPFRHDRKWHTPIAHFCIAIYNLCLDYEAHPRRFSKVYSGPVPTVAKPKKISKKGKNHSLKRYAILNIFCFFVRFLRNLTIIFVFIK